MNKDLEYFKKNFAEYIDFLYSLREKTKSAEVSMKDIKEPPIGLYGVGKLLDVRIASIGKDRKKYFNLRNKYFDGIKETFPSLDLMFFTHYLLKLQSHIHISEDYILKGISSPNQWTQSFYMTEISKSGFSFKDHYFVTTDSQYDECLEKVKREYERVIKTTTKIQNKNTDKNKLEETSKQNSDIFIKIKEAKEMYDAGIIDENEFKEIKSKLIKDM